MLDLARPFFAKAGIDPEDPRLPRALELTRDRAQRLSDIPALVGPAFFSEIEYDAEAVAKVTGREGIREVLEALNAGLEAVPDWNEDAIKQAIHDAADRLGQKMGAFMLPCRVATMGGTSGPDLMPMLVMMGRETALGRIAGLIGRLT